MTIKAAVMAYGEESVNLILPENESQQIKNKVDGCPLVVLNQRQLCDLEMLLSGAYNPLSGFMNQADYESVLNQSTLANGLLWTIPVVLDISNQQLDTITNNKQIGLCDHEGFMLAIMDIESIWPVNKDNEADIIYGTRDQEHPGVRYLYNEVKDNYIGGRVKGIQLPIHYDFESLRNTPADLHEAFRKKGWNKVMAFHTSKPMHRVHHEITTRAAKSVGANILIHPVAGVSKPGDMAYYSRVHCYQAIQHYYPNNMAMVSLLPLAMRMAGPREAVLNMIIRQNYGCSHFLVGPEHASPPGLREGGKRFYERYSAQKLVGQYQDKLDIQMVPIQELGYSKNNRAFVNCKDVQDRSDIETYNENNLNDDLEHDRVIPDWYSFPEVIEELGKIRLSRKRKGFTLFFTGLSGSGKSTLAKLAYARFIEQGGGRPVTLLDGDVVRQNLSSELGFSKEHRDLNVKRIGFVASEITKNRGIAICAPIAPYREIRRQVRELIEQHGAFIEIHVATPLEVCEQRDRKGLYAKARKGLVKNFTGISDPYDIPEAPEIRIDTSSMSPTEAAQEIMLYLFREGYLDQ
ncbi:MAG TPA: bifunctional sulfate adenylyltransferase/adenylylsulfate kinase [Gammaproteobacteria bacterium]